MSIKLVFVFTTMTFFHHVKLLMADSTGNLIRRCYCSVASFYARGISISSQFSLTDCESYSSILKFGKLPSNHPTSTSSVPMIHSAAMKLCY
eukprot:m.224269 g.224269  ORF g.224269 m.224269 type:complete len:92 (+) comp15647_c1_seq7:1055-1330(+)